MANLHDNLKTSMAAIVNKGYWILRYTRHFFGPSSYSLRIAVGHRAPQNECSANHMAEKTVIFVSLSCGGFSSGFSCCFHGKYHSTIIMNRLSYIIESCQSFQTVLFSGLRNISLQILRIVGRVWNEGSRMLCQWLPSPSTTTRRLVLQNLPSLGLPALIRSPPTRAFPFSLRTTSFRLNFPRMRLLREPDD